MSVASMGRPPAATDPRLRAFFAYWRSKAPPDRLPGRQHIDPLDIPRLLQHIAMFDVVRDGGVRDGGVRAGAVRFRFLLIGHAVVQLMGAGYTGLSGDQPLRPR